MAWTNGYGRWCFLVIRWRRVRRFLLGGIFLITLGLAVMLVREIVKVRDHERLLAQRHQLGLERVRAQLFAGGIAAKQANEMRAAASERAMNAYAAVFDAPSDPPRSVGR